MIGTTNPNEVIQYTNISIIIHSSVSRNGANLRIFCASDFSFENSYYCWVLFHLAASWPSDLERSLSIITSPSAKFAYIVLRLLQASAAVKISSYRLCLSYVRLYTVERQVKKVVMFNMASTQD